MLHLASAGKIQKSDELFGLGEILIALQKFADKPVQARICLSKPAAVVDAVCDVGESLRAKPADILKEVFFQYLTMQTGNAVYLIAGRKAEVCHVHLSVADDEVFADLFAAAEFGYEVLAPAAVNLAQYLPNTRQERLHEILRPFFERLAHDGMVGIRYRFAYLLPCLVPAEAVLIHHDAHELGDNERRVRIVYLYRVVL